MFLDNLLGWFSIDMGIDLGTCNTLVCVRGEGIVLNEPSVVAVYKGTNKVLDNGNAVGFRAKEMLGKTPGSISAIRPLKDGVISDFEVTEAMLGYFIRKVQGRTRFMRPRMVISVPSGITEVEWRAVIESAERAGARRVYTVVEPMAAGIGAGLPIAEVTSIRVAGDNMDESIINHMKKTYNLMIGEQTAERIKIEIGSAAPLAEELTMEVRGRDIISGLPRKTVVTSEEVREALTVPVNEIISAVTRTLERAEPELAADLVDNGINLAGGGALLRGLSTVMTNTTGLETKVADDPLTCVARGTSIYLENIEESKYSMKWGTPEA